MFEFVCKSLFIVQSAAAAISEFQLKCNDVNSARGLYLTLLSYIEVHLLTSRVGLIQCILQAQSVNGGHLVRICGTRRLCLTIIFI